MFGESDAMATEHSGSTPAIQCDICAKPLERGEVNTVGAPVVLRATAAGFLPEDTDQLSEAARQAGLSPSAFWRQIVDQNSDQEWDVCGHCHGRLERWEALATDHFRPNCWYCGQSESAPDSACECKLHRETEKPHIPAMPFIMDGQTATKLMRMRSATYYEQQSVYVPRCPRCHGIHKTRIELSQWTWGAIKFLVFGAAVCTAAVAIGRSDGFSTFGILLALVFGFAPAAIGTGILSYHIHHHRKHRTVKPLPTAYEHPSVKEQIESGWSQGAAPGQSVETFLSSG